ncbi:MAG: hypothetical protein IIA14_00940 [SAR324 cluster bacterium]|nr:hypothetical protein [SAR324 cluster bacterium]
MFGNSYLTPEEFKEFENGLDLTGINDDALGSLLMQATRTVDSYCHTSFGLNVVDMEQQLWNANRRIYPNKGPILALRNFRLLIGSRQFAAFSLRDIFINRTGDYVEVVSLATTTSLAAELISLGLSQIVAQYSYVYGTGEFDDSTANTAEAIGADAGNTGLDSFDVTDGTRFQVDDILRIDDEEMLVTVIAANTLTVLRGINHLEDAHVSGSDIYRMVSAAPDDVKIATGIIGGSYIAARRQNEEGVTGVRSFLIGSYSVSYGAGVQNAGGSGYPFVPDVAQMLLEPYRKIALR